MNKIKLLITKWYLVLAISLIEFTYGIIFSEKDCKKIAKQWRT